MATEKTYESTTDGINPKRGGGEMLHAMKMVLVALCVTMFSLFSPGASAQDSTEEEDFDEAFSLPEGDEEDDTEADAEDDLGDLVDEEEEDADAEAEANAELELPEADEQKLVFLTFRNATELLILISADESTDPPILWFTGLPSILQNIITEDSVGSLNADTLGLVSTTGLEGVSQTKELIAPRLAFLLGEVETFLTVAYDGKEEEDTSALTKAQTDLAAVQSDLVDAEDDDEKAELEAEIEELKAKIENLKANPQTKWVCDSGKVEGLVSFITENVWEKLSAESRSELQEFFDAMNTALKDGDDFNTVLNASALFDGAPEEVKEDAISTFLGALPVKFSKVKKGDMIIVRGDDGAFKTGSVEKKGNDGLTLKGKDGKSYSAAKGDSFWALGEGGGSGIANFAFFGIDASWGSTWMFNTPANRPAKEMWGQVLALELKFRPFKLDDKRLGIYFLGGLRVHRFAATMRSASHSVDGMWDAQGVVGIGGELAFNETFKMGLGANFLVSTGGIGGSGTLSGTLTPFSKARCFGFTLAAEGGYQQLGIGLGEAGDPELSGGFLTIFVGITLEFGK